MKTIKIEKVDNGFIVYLNFREFEMGSIPSFGDRKVFNTQAQLNRFLSEHFKSELS